MTAFQKTANIVGESGPDGVVDIYDLRQMAEAWLAKSYETNCGPGEPCFNPSADLNSDGRIDNCDSDILAANWALTGDDIAGASDKHYYYHYDGLGSVVAVSD